MNSACAAVEYRPMAEAWFPEHLACPDCRMPLSGDACACGFAVPAGRPLDLRPQHPEPRTFAHHIGTSARGDLASMRIERPVVTYDGPRATRDSSELFSA